ncbi:MAG: hypothetical protein ACYDHN_14140 [Solirubrobacteraceae bacterium]
MITLVEDKLRERSDFWLRVGRASGVAYATHPLWLFRRVETIDFVGSGSVKRRVSIDFEVPESLPSLKENAVAGMKLVPISVYPKWPPLMGFDFIGSDGRPTALYRRITNRQLDFGLLLGMVDYAVMLSDPAGATLTREVLTPGIQGQLRTLVADRRPEWPQIAQTTNKLKAYLSNRLGGTPDVADQIAATVDLAGRLADSSILWVGVDGEPGTDRIVKFCYDDPYSKTEPWYRRWATACSWRQSNVFISLPHAGRNTIFHLDIQAPHGCVEIAGIDVTALPAANHKHAGAEAVSVEELAERYPDEIKKPDRWVGPASTRFYLDYGKPSKLVGTSDPNRSKGRLSMSEREAAVEIGDGRAHVYLGPKSAPSHRVFLQVKLAMRRDGFVTGCLRAAFGIAVLMSVTWWQLESAADHLEPTAVLLSIVPLVLGYVLVRPGEDALEHHHLSGVRLTALMSGALPIVGTLTLVLTHKTVKGLLPDQMPPDVSVARWVWLGLMICSWVLFLLLLGSFVRARNSEGLLVDSIVESAE